MCIRDRDSREKSTPIIWSHNEDGQKMKVKLITGSVPGLREKKKKTKDRGGSTTLVRCLLEGRQTPRPG